MKKKVNNDFIKQGAASIKEEDIRSVIDKAEEIDEKVRNSSSLRKFLDELSLLASLIKDYWKGDYRTVPYKTIATVAFTLLYVLSVVDLIPDVIPGMGLLDDASVIAFCLKMVSTEIEKYKTWKTSSK